MSSHYHQTKEFRQNDPGIVQLFIDGMHLHHQSVPSFYWGDPKEPLTLYTNTNRKRLNILGAYDQKTQKLTHLTSEENCDALRIIEFFELIERTYENMHSVVLYTDNASYFHAEIVQEWLEKHPKIIVEHLPPYAPNLNLIERLWRFVKGKLVRNRYYEKYITFRTTVFRLLSSLDHFCQKLEFLLIDNHKSENFILKINQALQKVSGF